VVLTAKDKVKPLAQYLIKAFDEQAPLLYNTEDRSAGYIIVRDRQDRKVRHPLITLSIAIVTTDSLSYPSRSAVSAPRSSITLRSYQAATVS